MVTSAGKSLIACAKETERKQAAACNVSNCIIAIAAFYGAGLMWGRQTHLTIAEYWRWWVVHLMG